MLSLIAPSPVRGRKDVTVVNMTKANIYPPATYKPHAN